MKRISTLISSIFIFILTASFIFGGEDTSSVESKQFKISIMEAKKGGKAGLAEEDVCVFKSGKFRTVYFKQNAGAEAIPIELTKDSTYFDEAVDSDMIYVEFEGEITNKLEETVKIVGTIDGYSIEGNVKLSKKDKVKKNWSFSGSLKEKKKKK